MELLHIWDLGNMSTAVLLSSTLLCFFMGACGVFLMRNIAGMEYEEEQQQQQHELLQNVEKHEQTKEGQKRHDGDNSKETCFPFVPDNFALKKKAADFVKTHTKEEEEEKKQRDEMKQYGRRIWMTVFLLLICAAALFGFWAVKDANASLGLDKVSDEKLDDHITKEDESASMSRERVSSRCNSHLELSKGDELCAKGCQLLLRGKYSTALEYLSMGLAQDEDCKDNAKTMCSLAPQHILMENAENAVLHYTEGYFRAYNQNGDTHDATTVWLAAKLGFLWYQMEEFETSIKWFRLANNTDSDAVDLLTKNNQAWILSGHASSMGQLPAGIVSNSLLRAYDMHSESLKLFEALEDMNGTAQELSNAGNLLLRHVSAIHDKDHNEKGDPLAEKGYMLVNSGWKLQRDIHDLKGEARSISFLADRYTQIERYNDALDHYIQASYIYRHLKDARLWADTISKIAAVHLDLGQTSEAFRCYKRALEKYAESGDILGYALRLGHVGDAFVRSGEEHFDKAIETYRNSIHVFQSIWASLSMDTLRLSLDEKARQTSKGLESLLFEMNQTTEALEVSEQSRGQSLETLLATNRQKDHCMLPPHQLSFDDVTHLAKTQEATIVVYSWISYTKILVWVVNEESLFPMTATIVRKPRFKGFIRYLRNQYERTSDLRRHYDELVLPIENFIKGSKSLLIVPDGELFRVPFAALINQHGRHLIQDFIIRISTSLGAIVELEGRVLETSQEQFEGLQALVVGDPRRNLPGSVQESTHAANAMREKNIDVELLLYENATKDKVLQSMKSSSYIHFSAHGGHDYLELANKGSDLLSKDLEVNSLHRTKLVVLSACDTLRGKIRADGVYGLVRAFVAAGAPAVIATLWEVEDDDRLMRYFYDGVFSKLFPSAAEAFRDAVLSLIYNGVDHSFWSPFVILYDAKPLKSFQSC